MAAKDLTVVSVTPVAVETDSRTYKQAATLSRAGFRSVVFEGRTSHLARQELPFQLLPHVRTSKSRNDTSGRSAAPVGRRSLRLARLWRRLQSRPHSWFGNSALFVAYLGYYLFRLIIVPLVRLPQANLYVVHEFSTFPAVWLRARMCGAPVIYDVHDFYSRIVSEQEKTPFEKRWIGPFHLWIERMCVSRASAVMTVSDGLANAFASEFATKPTVVRHFHDFRLDRQPASGLRCNLGLGRDQTLLVTVGQFKKGMAIDQMLDAMALLPATVHWAIVGPGYADLSRQICRRGIEERVHVVEPVKPFEVVPFISDADIGILIYYERSDNYRYALPNGFFQIVAAKLPVLYPDLPEMARLMREQGLGVQIDSLSPERMAASIQLLIDTPDRAGTSEARRKLAEALSWAFEEQKFLNVINSVSTEAFRI